MSGTAPDTQTAGQSRIRCARQRAARENENRRYLYSSDIYQYRKVTRWAN